MEGEEVEEVVSKLEAEVMAVVVVVVVVAEGWWGVEEEAMMEIRHSLKVGDVCSEVLQWEQVFK